MVLVADADGECDDEVLLHLVVHLVAVVVGCGLSWM